MNKGQDKNIIQVLYDTQIFQKQRYGGISRYFKELLNHFAGSKGTDCIIPITFSDNPFLQNIIAGKYPLNGPLFNKLNCSLSRYPYWGLARHKVNTVSEYMMCVLARYDIYHPTYYNPQFADLMKDKPLVLTVHDMIHELYPEYYHPDDKTRERKKSLISRATKIIAVSNNTKADILQFYKVDPSKITVIYHGNHLCYRRGFRFSLPDRYILFVGERIRYKNFQLFVNAIAKLLRQSDQYLVCIGGGDITPEETQLFLELNIKEKVIHNSVSDLELGEVYAKAQLFVYPSLYEGFGMPVLEAFACGCPVALSNTSSLPEIADDAAVYFDPLSEASLIQSIEQILGDGNLRQEMVTRGLNRAKAFSWEKAAKETRDLYRTICNF